MKNVEITITKKFTQEDIDDIMVSALEGGITYWCGRCEVVGEYLGEYASEQLSRGGKLILHDTEDDEETWELDLEKLQKGIKRAIEEDAWDGDMNNYDEVTADIIVQYALFDEIVFS